MQEPGTAAAPRIASLGHVGIFVEDIDRSIAFYRDLLGLTVTDYDEKAGMCFLSSRPREEHHEFLRAGGGRSRAADGFCSRSAFVVRRSPM
jgi:catechol 2,3-dioxygenase-like lactoylglutathione lyase family enzyme